MKESKILYIVKRLSKKLDKKNDEAISLAEHYHVQMDVQKNRGSYDGFIEAMQKKYSWLGYSMAMDYCHKLVSELATDVKGLEDEEISDE